LNKKYNQPEDNSLKQKIYIIIFEADTPAGKFFDVSLIISIILSVIAVMLDSIVSINAVYGDLLYFVEWVFTIIFTIEYILRLYCARRPGNYARSFFGIVDIMAILPTYISMFFPGSQYLIAIRILRILRVFRVLKLVEYSEEAQTLMQALRASKRKIIVFIYVVLTLVIIFGSLMYLIEGEKSGFTSIPKGVYWAIVTMTTVGYGDISPQTNLGQMLAAVIMIMGYGIIAVPTGIITAEFMLVKDKFSHVVCPECSVEEHSHDAKFCKDCGEKL
jgi:voltage-gated potassium channel